LKEVWHYTFVPKTNLIDVHMGRLRRKIDGPNGPFLIRNVRGIGFVLSATPFSQSLRPRPAAVTATWPSNNGSRPVEGTLQLLDRLLPCASVGDLSRTGRNLVAGRLAQGRLRRVATILLSKRLEFGRDIRRQNIRAPYNRLWPNCSKGQEIRSSSEHRFAERHRRIQPAISLLRSPAPLKASR